MEEILFGALAILLLLIPLGCALWSISCIVRLFKDAQFSWAMISIIAFICPFVSLFLAGLGLTLRKETEEAGIYALKGATISFFIFAFIFAFTFDPLMKRALVDHHDHVSDRHYTPNNMHTTQLAVEDYAVQNVGNYPADTINFSSSIPTGGIGVRFKNPYNTAQPAIVGGIPTQYGQVGYEHSRYGSRAYTIYGYGKKGILKNDAGATFTLTSDN